MGFLSALLGKDQENAAKDAALLTDQRQKDASRDRLAANDVLSDQLRGFGEQFESGPPRDESFERLAQVLGFGGRGEFDFDKVPVNEFIRREDQTEIERLIASGRVAPGGAGLKALTDRNQDRSQGFLQDYINNVRGAGALESGLSQQDLQRQSASLFPQQQGAFNIFQNTTGEAGSRFGSPSPIAQGNIAGAQARADGAGNILNAGLKLAGMFAPIPGV